MAAIVVRVQVKRSPKKDRAAMINIKDVKKLVESADAIYEILLNIHDMDVSSEYVQQSMEDYERISSEIVKDIN